MRWIFYRAAPIQRKGIKPFEPMDLPVASLILKKGREKPIRNRHPWIFSGAISKVVGSTPEPGQLVDIFGHDRGWLARAYYNPHSQIRARILTWQAEEVVDRQFWSERIAQAINLRGLLEVTTSDIHFHCGLPVARGFCPLRLETDEVLELDRVGA